MGRGHDDRLQPVPPAVRWVLTILVTVSALDDVRSILEAVSRHGLQSGHAWALLGTLGYGATAVLLAYRPHWAPLAFGAFLLGVYHSPRGLGVAILSYVVVVIGAYVLPWRWFLGLLVPWLAWALVPGTVWRGGSLLGSLLLMTLLVIPARSVRGLAQRAEDQRAEDARQMREAKARAEEAARRAAEGEEAHQRERALLSRELHDVVAHELTRIAMLATAAARDPAAPAGAKDALAEIGEASRLGLTQMRRLVRILTTDVGERTDPSDGVGGASLGAALDQAREYLTGVGMRVTTRVAGPVDELTSDLVLTASRVLREGSTNVVKHNGPGSACELVALVGPATLTLVVRNEVSRPLLELPESGFGLVALTERVTHLEGRLRTGLVDGWWELEVTLPRP